MALLHHFTFSLLNLQQTTSFGFSTCNLQFHPRATNNSSYAVFKTPKMSDLRSGQAQARGLLEFQNDESFKWCRKLDMKLLAVSLLTIISGSFNNVGAFMLGQVMPGYPMFLLYWTTFLYSLGFLIFAVINRESLWTDQPHKEFLILGLFHDHSLIPKLFRNSF